MILLYVKYNLRKDSMEHKISNDSKLVSDLDSMIFEFIGMLSNETDDIGLISYLLAKHSIKLSLDTNKDSKITICNVLAGIISQFDHEIKKSYKNHLNENEKNFLLINSPSNLSH